MIDASKSPSERMTVLMISAIQFINVLEFMMVMPLGPDFARELGIPASSLGMIGGSYTAAAALAGIVTSTFIERLDRRVAIAGAMTGLIVATAAAGLATTMGTLMVARVAAGFFGGPAASLSLAIVADVIPPARRGKAMGTVMGSFALASVAGVPAGLELARLGGWRTPFYAVAGLGIVIVGFAVMKLPSLTGHLALDRSVARSPTMALLKRPVVILSLAMTACAMMAMFLLIPNLAAYAQGNLGYPREKMGLLYLAGGGMSLFSMRLVGKLTDRYGSFIVGTVGTALMITCVYFGFVNYLPGLPVMAIFVSFMVAASTRNVPYNALTSMVPAPDERARFMSIQSSVQHVASASGAFLSSQILEELPNHGLANIDLVAFLTMALAATMPFFMRAVQIRVRRPVRSA